MDKVLVTKRAHELYEKVRQYFMYTDIPLEHVSRFHHQVLTTTMATDLIKHYKIDVDIEKVQIACFTHDYAKKLKDDEIREQILLNLDPVILTYPKAIWHAYLAPFLIKRDLGIDDEEIFEAIRVHPTGKPNMNMIEKLLFISDYIETSRTYPTCVIARDLAYKNIDKAVKYKLEKTIEFLKTQNSDIHPLTIQAYEYYKNI